MTEAAIRPNRTRRYMFEQAYADYSTMVRHAADRILATCRRIWRWFWRERFTSAVERILTAATIAGVVGFTWTYASYLYKQAGAINGEAFGSLFIVAVFAAFLLQGWKGIVHTLSITFAAALASSLVLAVSLTFGLITAAIFIVYFVGLLEITLSFAFVFVPMRIAHFVWSIYYRVSHVCPFHDCPHQGEPTYECTCGAQYQNLRPNFYGVFYHRCIHGREVHRLPTLNFRGRNTNVRRLCRGCLRPVDNPDWGLSEVFPIPIIAGDGAGKSVFVAQAVRRLEKRINAIDGANLKLGSQYQRELLTQAWERLDQGIVLTKTAGDISDDFRAFELTVKVPPKVSSLVYLFDAPGEHFTSLNDFCQKDSMKNARALIFIIDPLRLTGFDADFESFNGSRAGAPTRLYDLVSNFIEVVESFELKKHGNSCDRRLAVVITKADVHPDLQRLCASRTNPVSQELIEGCRQFLIDNAESNCVRLLEDNFSDIGYFACSPLGRSPEPLRGEPFQPKGTTEPLLWLLGIERDVSAATPSSQAE